MLTLSIDKTTGTPELLPPWAQLRPIRVRVTLEHLTPFDRQYTKEIVVINSGATDVDEMLIPLPEFLHGLKVLDEDNSILSFYSNAEIENKIMNYDRDLRENIRHQLDEVYLLWIRLPNNKIIRSEEIRTIRLVYSDSMGAKMTTSIFDIPQYDDNIFSPDNTVEEYYFITPPKDFRIEMVKSETYAFTEPIRPEDGLPEKVDIKYLENPSPSDFKDDCIDIKNNDSFITARFPNRDLPYKVKLNYQIKLPKIEHNIWSIVLPVAAVLLGLLAIISYLQIQSLLLGSGVLLAIGGSVSSVCGALIALITNPLIRRTRALLFIHLGLAIIIMLSSAASVQANTPPS